MRYLCVHCDHRFEAEGEPPRRCPACMRATGVQPVRDELKPVQHTRSRKKLGVIVGIGVITLAAAGGGYFVFGRRPSAGEHGEGGPLPAKVLHETLVSQHIEAGELENLLVADSTIAAFAEKSARSATTPAARAEAITKAIRERASALAFVPWSLGEPRTTQIGTAPQTLAAISKDKARLQLYPLELAALEVSALRALDVPAMIAELISVDQERAPLDPSGYLGYFVVAVYPGEPGLGTPRLYDPYGGRTLTPEHCKSHVLSDTRALAAALAVRALHEVSYLADPKRGLASSGAAIQLAGSLPSVRTVRAMVVLAGRQVEQGLQEFVAASQLRSDAPRLHNLASAELMTGEVERSLKDLDAALIQAPDFAAAHATRGSLALVRGDEAEARSELAEAERLAPDLSLVSWAQAELRLRDGDREGALATARRALSARPSFDAHVRMGVLLRQLTQFDELRKVAAELLAMAPDYRKGEVRELISNVMGPAALDADARDPEAEPSDLPTDLPAGSVPPLTAPSPTGRSEPSFRLRGANDDLQLKLNR